MLAPAFAGPIARYDWLSDANAFDLAVDVQANRSMPRIADKNLDGVAFLFRTEQEARERKRLGGTGFFVGRELRGSTELFGYRLCLNYLVSNKHVVFGGSACVASVNRKDGGAPDIFDIDQEEWVAHPTADLAACCLAERFNRAIHRVTFQGPELLLTPEIIKEKDIGTGDEVFMIGRFVNHQGEKENAPALRFGSLSMMLGEFTFKGPLGPEKQEGFAVEMRSRTGFSGSPVFIYRTIATTLAEVPKEQNTSSTCWVSTLVM